MHHDATPAADEPAALHETTTTAPALDPERPVRDLCMSVFDRWRCGREDGHTGAHTAGTDDATASWNDSAAGRRLRWR
ncbi:hypothetical protein [Curtobacterium sp. B8]|uniref:hypothetical protein n=1 Tax=Curtobacterium sp. B8 TaxID=95611 RepID=UPI00034B2918|nr:hypothetical protein [Curtobacterium sp. B8]